MFDYHDFQQVFPAGSQLPYDGELQADIEDNRKTFGGVLFIDRVIKALGFAKGKVYPPKSDNGLRQLHRQICEASMSLHHKFSILYYILLDFDESNARNLPSEAFSSSSGMPRNYQILMKGLWHLDHQEFSKSLEYIAHPSLIPDFADDILTALVRHADDPTALAYYYTVRPILNSSSALQLLFDAMARTNITEALLFSRTQPEHTRETLFQRLLSVALGGKSQDFFSEVAFLPFEADEEAWLEEYLTNGDGRLLKKAKDTLLVRKIAGDRFEEMAQIRSGGQWGPVLDGIKTGTKGQTD
ncbi:hypothetical protein GMORB2_1469 [Geosmithia morbida]|uniref:ELYS-like domain-containing protein n=1 Tax=Geosmithia morbida TaxID=1094350 RepID=A0A9P4Z2V9_9HYPO|nr:uncharacterized protein GMORB2_1469 [Geosmithia morbida]KAF4126223.1 hypothetical protein GMORB2_1469 [Geosmithia morbida]